MRKAKGIDDNIDDDTITGATISDITQLKSENILIRSGNVTSG